MSKLFALWKKLIDKLNTKADLVDGKVPTEQLPDDIGGGVSSWNDLEDKPFGESKAFEDIIWDGNTEGLESTSADLGGTFVYWYKVNDEFIPSSAVDGGVYLRPASLSPSGQEEEMTIDGHWGEINVYDNGSFSVGVCVVGINTPNTTLDLDGLEASFPSEGIWFIGLDFGAGFEFTRYLKSPVSIKHLDEKYIPDSIARQSDIDTLISALSTAIGSGVLE